MRFSVSSTALSSKLTALSRVINSKNSLPILGDFVFEISDLGNNPIRIIEREPERISVSNEQEEKSVNGKTTVEKKEHKGKFSDKEQASTTVFTDSITLQSDDSHAERGYIQQDQAQQEGNNTQRGCCKAREALFRVIWSGCGYERVRRDEGEVLRSDPRMVRYRKRSAGILLGKEKTGSGGRRRAGEAKQSDLGQCSGKKRSRNQSIEPDAWEQCKGAILFIYTNGTGGLQ